MEEGRDAAGRFDAGNPGRPKGAKGKRPAILRALDDLVANDAEDIIRIVVDTAKAGDMRAAEILLRRLWPEPKGRVINFDIPPVLDGAHDMITKIQALIASVAAGELSPEEANQVASLLDLERKVIEVSSLEERIQSLEKAQRERRD
jgi:hypothetical protein